MNTMVQKAGIALVMSEKSQSEDAKPGISNLITIYSALSNTPLDKCIEKFDGMERYGDLKKEVIEVVLDTLSPIQERYQLGPYLF